jgi:ribonuclease D
MAGKSKKRRRHNKNISKSEENQEDFADSDGPDSEESMTSPKQPTNREVMEKVESVLSQLQQSQEFISSKFDKFEALTEKLLAENIAIKKDIQILHQADMFQQQQTSALNVRMDEIEQKYLSNDLALTGLPNLNSISAETI